MKRQLVDAAMLLQLQGKAKVRGTRELFLLAERGTDLRAENLKSFSKMKQAELGKWIPQGRVSL